MNTRKALSWIAFWFMLAVLFDIGVYYFMGREKALEFIGGYVIEQSLSVDNLFLFLLIFCSFHIPAMYQRRVLTYGIIGAVVLRLIFITLGIAMIQRFEWILYLFGVILIISGIKIFFADDTHKDFKNSILLRGLGKIVRITPGLHGEKFFVTQNGLFYATPLFAILILIEFSDLLFAIDSIPAVFSITRDPLIAFSSNIFAILGLRNMYFIIEKIHDSFRFVKYGVALILVFTGFKLSVLFFGLEVPLWFSLVTIFSVIIICVVISLLFPPKEGLKCDEIYSFNLEE